LTDSAAVTIRRARPDDAAFLAGLSGHDDVEPFLGRATATDAASIREEIERSLAEPEAVGRFVIEVHGERAGMMGFTRINERSRIARLGGLAIHPDFRGRRLADEAARLLQRHLLGELGFHRLELEIYAFNERAVAHAERAGFVREGLRRKAYLRHGTWNDAVLFGLTAEDLAPA
jgi:RimJ/RimL family protein N-acetyltransferase